MSNQRLISPLSGGKATLSQEEILDQFRDRKQNNLEKIKQFSFLDFRPKWAGQRDIPVTVDDSGEEVTGCFCSYCKEYLKGENPWKRGVYVFPTCSNCLEYIGVVEDYLSSKKGDNSMRTRKTMVEPQSVSVDWDGFEKLIENKQAKLSLLSKKYKVYPSELKEIITVKYGEKVVFKKGRYGGIFWNETPNNKEG